MRRLCAVLASSAACSLGPSAVWLPAAGAAPAACVNAGLHPSAANLGAVETATLCLINRVRAAHKLSALRANRELGGVAGGQVRQMVRLNYFADVRPTGQTPLSLVTATPYPANAGRVSVGQNIAWGTGRLTTPQSIVAAWMASPPHREIVLDGEFRDAGVAATPATPTVLGARRGGATYVIEFGVRHF